MSFGCYKNGTNNTDRKLITQWTAAGWPIDKISAKLSIRTPIIEAFLAESAPDKKAAKTEKVDAPEKVAKTEKPAKETKDK